MQTNSEPPAMSAEANNSRTASDKAVVCKELLERIAYVLYLETWTNTDEDVADLKDEHLQSLGEKWRKEWLPGRYSEHCGDCTNVPMACHRCIMDELFKNAERILRSNDQAHPQPGAAVAERKGKIEI